MDVLAIHKISELSGSLELDGLTTGKVVAIDQQGSVFIDFAGNPRGPVKARMTAAAMGHISQRSGSDNVAVLIAFEANDIHRPVIIDIIHDRIEPAPLEVESDRCKPEQVKVDGETVTLDAKKEIVLRCGKASITLTSAGKVLIRGAYLLNRSSGVNRIKGGSVQIN